MYVTDRQRGEHDAKVTTVCDTTATDCFSRKNDLEIEAELVVVASLVNVNVSASKRPILRCGHIKRCMSTVTESDAFTCVPMRNSSCFLLRLNALFSIV